MKWEYSTFFINPEDSMRDALNRHGGMGWELVQILKSPGVSPMLVFKRPDAARSQTKEG